MGKKRGNKKRLARAEATAAEVLDNVAQAGAEKRAFGVKVDENAPDSALFTVDRSGLSKNELSQELLKKDIAAAKERRKTSFRSEEGVLNTSRVTPVIATIPGQKKAPPIGTLEKRLLEQRTFKRPSKRKPAKAPSFNQDLWGTPLASEVAASKSKERKNIEKKVNASVKNAKVMLTPSDGLSVNPVFDAHQDALGEAVADIMEKKFDQELTKKMMSCDFSKLPKEKDDDGDDIMDDKNEAQDDENEVDFVAKEMPERKTRVERNKAGRLKVEMKNKLRRIEKRRIAKDYDNLEKIAREAIREADKLNGETKRKKMALIDNLPAPESKPLFKQIAKEKVRTEAEIFSVPLSNDLDSKMRSVAMPVGNTAIKDRFLSLERRGLVEPTAVMKREARQARQERRAALLRDKPRKNKRGSRSKISYWRQGGKRKK